MVPRHYDAGNAPHRRVAASAGGDHLGMSKCRYDLSEDCNNTDCLNCALDKIKAEIMSLTNGDMPERIWNVDVIDVIDRYKVGSEEQA